MCDLIKVLMFIFISSKSRINAKNSKYNEPQTNFKRILKHKFYKLLLKSIANYYKIIYNVINKTKEAVEMKAFLGITGFLLMVGGAGNSDCGGDLLPSVITAFIGLCMMSFAVKDEV